MITACYDWYVEVIDGLICNNRRNMSPSRKTRVVNRVKKELINDYPGCKFSKQTFNCAYREAVAFQRDAV